MIDIEKAIEDFKKEKGIKLTEQQMQAAKGLGMFLNAIWEAKDTSNSQKERNDE